MMKDTSRPAVKYLTANDTLNQAEQIVSPIAGGDSIMKMLKACQCVLCYIVDPLNDSVVRRFPDLASNMLEMLEGVKVDLNERFIQSLRTAVALASASALPSFSSAAAVSEQDRPESPAMSQSNATSDPHSPPAKPRRRKVGAVDEYESQAPFLFFV